jgi:hypothetical protein
MVTLDRREHRADFIAGRGIVAIKQVRRETVIAV